MSIHKSLSTRAVPSDCVVGAVALGVVYILMKKGIAQINVGTFFTISKWLLGALAVYFAYNGVHELLELMEGSH